MYSPCCANFHSPLQNTLVLQQGFDMTQITSSYSVYTVLHAIPSLADYMKQQISQPWGNITDTSLILKKGGLERGVDVGTFIYAFANKGKWPTK